MAKLSTLSPPNVASFGKDYQSYLEAYKLYRAFVEDARSTAAARIKLQQSEVKKVPQQLKTTPPLTAEGLIKTELRKAELKRARNRRKRASKRLRRLKVEAQEAKLMTVINRGKSEPAQPTPVKGKTASVLQKQSVSKAPKGSDDVKTAGSSKATSQPKNPTPLEVARSNALKSAPDLFGRSPAQLAAKAKAEATNKASDEQILADARRAVAAQVADNRERQAAIRFNTQQAVAEAQARTGWTASSGGKIRTDELFGVSRPVSPPLRTASGDVIVPLPPGVVRAQSNPRPAGGSSQERGFFSHASKAKNR